jgi:uncharacterized membrane protein YhaH (DUF805 family)
MQNLSPIGWALRPLKNYANFSGRASRAEFWWFFLFVLIVYLVFSIALFATVDASASPAVGAQPSFALFGAFGAAGMFMIFFYLALLLPTIAVQVRRLHDTNRSGWWLGILWLMYPVYMALILGSSFSLGQAEATRGVGLAIASAIFALVFFVYSIVLFVFFCLRGTQGANRFGDDPYGPDVGQVFA